MSEVAIPAASLTRLRASYEQFSALVQVVAEAMQIDQVESIDLPRGVLVVKDDAEHARANGQMPEEVSA